MSEETSTDLGEDRELEVLAETLVERLWQDHLDHATRAGITDEDGDLVVPPMGILTTRIVDENTGRFFRIAVHETNENEDYELGLTAESQLNLLLLRTSRMMQALHDLHSNRLKVSMVSGSDLVRQLMGMADSLGITDDSDDDEIVVGPTVPLDGLTINGPNLAAAESLRKFDLVSRIRMTYRDLVEMLGMPRELPTDASRMDAQWTLEWDDGTAVSIHNLDDGPVTLGSDGPTVEELNVWFVTSNDSTAATRVGELLGLTRGPVL